MNTSFLSATTASTLAFSYLVIQTVIKGVVIGVVINTLLTSGQRPLIQSMPESPLTSMDIGREAADWWVLDWDKWWLKEILWRTIWWCTFSKWVSQLDSQPFTQSRGRSVGCWRVSQSVGYKSCDRWCADWLTPYFRSASTDSSYAGVAFNVNGHRTRSSRLMSVGLR